jgi:hypothetical protein
VVNATKIDLTWPGNNQGISYDVYFGESSSSVKDANHESPEFKQNQTNKIFTATGLAFNKTYYWRVDMLKSDGNVIPGMTWAVNTRLPPPSSELTVVNGSFESPTIDEAVAQGNPGEANEANKWADTLRCNGWVGSKGGVCREMVVDGNQNFYWYDPQSTSIEQKLGDVSGDTDKTYTVQYTRKIVAQPSIAKLKFRAELLVGGEVVDFEELNNASAIQEKHRLSYTNDGSRAGQPITIRFSAHSSKRYTNSSEAQMVFIDSVLAFDTITPNVVNGETSAVRTQPSPPSTEMTVINGSFESPSIEEAIANGISGQIGHFAGLLRFKGWVGKGDASTTMVAEGKQCLHWVNPNDESIEQTLGYLTGEIGKTYIIQYTRQINAEPSLATLKFRAELLVGDRVVDFEEISNARAGKGIRWLKYTSDGKGTGQPFIIRFTADSHGGTAIQRVQVDDVKFVTEDDVRRTKRPAKK